VAALAELDHAGEELARWVRDKRYGVVRVLDASYTVDRDADEVPAIFLKLVLSDPPEGEETWPLESVLRLRRSVLERVDEQGLEAPVYVQLTPQTDELDDDEELDDDSGL
jgi:hypothetical protein